MTLEYPKYLNENDILTGPELDNGILVNYFTNPINFGAPHHYYQYASSTPDGSLFPWNKKKFLLNSPHGQFEKMSGNHPEYYAKMIMAYFNHIGSVSLSQEKTDEVIEKMCSQIENQKPLLLTICYSWQKFPLAPDEVDIKTGKSPDIADLEFLHVLQSINSQVINNVYPPGFVVKILNESKAFLDFSAYSLSELETYEKQIKTWTDQLGWSNMFIFSDLLEECRQYPNYLQIVNQLYEKYLTSFSQQGVDDNLFIKAEARNVFTPLIGLQLDADTLLRLFSQSGFIHLAGLTCSWDPPTNNDNMIWDKIMKQAILQAAYSRAFLDTRHQFPLNSDAVPITIISEENKITVPSFFKKAQEQATHWHRGIKVFPTAGVGIMYPAGIATIPLYAAKTKAKSIKFSEELGVHYFSAI